MVFKFLDFEVEDIEDVVVYFKFKLEKVVDNCVMQLLVEVCYYFLRKVMLIDIVCFWEEGCEEFFLVCQWLCVQKIG